MEQAVLCRRQLSCLAGRPAQGVHCGRHPFVCSGPCWPGLEGILHCVGWPDSAGRRRGHRILIWQSPSSWWPFVHRLLEEEGAQVLGYPCWLGLEWIPHCVGWPHSAGRRSGHRILIWQSPSSRWPFVHRLSDEEGAQDEGSCCARWLLAPVPVCRHNLKGTYTVHYTTSTVDNKQATRLQIAIIMDW